MGSALKRASTYEILYQLNVRFAPGPALKEMVEIQKTHKIFSSENSLQQSHRQLRIGPIDFREREIYYQLLDELKNTPSDTTANGHDRIIEARQSNLARKTPLPMYTKTHPASEGAGVKVSVGRPHPGDRTRYVIISIEEPMRYTPTAAPRPRKRAR